MPETHRFDHQRLHQQPDDHQQERPGTTVNSATFDP
jgi:hypothetical protein